MTIGKASTRQFQTQLAHPTIHGAPANGGDESIEVTA